MEPLTENFEELKINSSKKTGLVYNEQMLLHSSLPKKHYENPQRLEAILSHLSAKSLLQNPNVELIKHINPALDSCIMACHPSSYIEYVAEMFPPECEKKSIFIFDSYYNKYTNLAARIAISSLNLCVDKVLTNEWKNAYALVRPPGHHSGHHSTINGFCVFNNVAIAVKYAQRLYNTKKILIFDWDIHHGDGTEHIFYKDPSVREAEGRGFNINIGWNTNKNSVGTDDYIYAFERVLFPIFQEFNPNLIFISAGFDSCKGDPLGKIDLNPEGFGYMLRKLQSLANGKIILALEGGYNTRSLSICSETVVKVLMNESIPLSCSDIKMSMEEMKVISHPNDICLNAVETVLKYIKEFWEKTLENKDVIEFEENKKIMNYLNFERKKQCIVKGVYFLKKTNEIEKKIYEALAEKKEKWICNFFGSEKIFGVEYIKLENVYNKNWGIAGFLEMKIAKNTDFFEENPEKNSRRLEKDEKSSTKQLGFRVTHGQFLQNNKELYKIKKKDCYSKLSQKEEVENIIEMFLSNDKNEKYGTKFFIENLEKILIFLKNDLNKELWRSISIIFILDAENKIWDLKMFDFKHIEKKEQAQINTNILGGIEKIYGIFSKILISEK